MTDTLTGMQAALSDIVTAMMGRGLVKPNATLWLDANTEPRIHVSWKMKDIAGYDARNDKFQSFCNKNGLDQSILDARSFIEAMPPKAERDRQMFMEQLSETIEIGKRIGIEDGFVNPLLDMMKKLSENAITDGSK